MIIPRLIYGGSFNPVHKGHLATIEYILKEQICYEIFIIPTYQSPLKEKNQYAPAEIRFEILQIALRSYFNDDLYNKIKLLDIEIKEKTINYTANTLRKLQDNIKTGLLLGADSLETLHLWKEIEWILTYYPIFIIQRASQSLKKTKKQIQQLKSFFPMGEFIILEFTPPNCSSSDIRKKIQESINYESLKDCLLPEVYSLIKKYKLYL
ncbi:MAG: putative nicotinate-nucleotide adenylyltransferase [Leptospiraceae bacterium]|nr:MAG: putative nicotinate-nucleotide adenylyltransferase [Leptospiraceae bacterium]